MKLELEERCRIYKNGKKIYDDTRTIEVNQS
jgi:hypothetical protein